MDIDIERLKWNAEYWDEVAPEGATHVLIYKGGLSWERWKDKIIYVWDGIRYLKHVGALYSSGNKIPRPTNPAAPEWDGEGLPPVGCECEVMLTSGHWEWCKVKAHSGSGSWIVTKIADRVIRNDLAKWRPIRTQAERNRDELAEVIMDLMFPPNNAKTTAEMADAIIAAGYRKGE